MCATTNSDEIAMIKQSAIGLTSCTGWRRMSWWPPYSAPSAVSRPFRITSSRALGVAIIIASSAFVQCIAALATTHSGPRALLQDDLRLTDRGSWSLVPNDPSAGRVAAGAPRELLADEPLVTDTGSAGQLLQSMQCSSAQAMFVDGASWKPPSFYFTVRCKFYTWYRSGAVS